MFKKKQKLTKLCCYAGADHERFSRIIVLEWQGYHIYYGLSLGIWYQLDITGKQQQLTFNNQVLECNLLMLGEFLNSDQVEIWLEYTKGHWIPKR